MTTLIIKNSSTTSVVPAAENLVAGELAINTADQKLFTKQAGGSVVELGNKWGGYTVSTEATGTDANTIYFRT